MKKITDNRVGKFVIAGVMLLSLLGCIKPEKSDINIAESSSVNLGKNRPEKAYIIDKKLIEANTRFGFKLFGKIINTERDEKNIFVSPTSVAIALSMLYNGAEGSTQQAMAQTLELQGVNDINGAFGTLRKSLENPDRDVELTIANSLWAKRGVPFRSEFIETNQQYYGAEVTELDFRHRGAAKEINSWVSNNTKGKIKQIVDQVNPDDVLFLINAIYFKGSWENPFEKEQTADRPFYLADGSKKNHPMMSQTDEYRYYETEEFQVVSLPYSQGRLSLYVFLPREQQSLKGFYQQLNAENWQKWMSQLSKRDGTIELPRFKMEYGIELSSTLKALGMSEAFDSTEANFSGLSEIKINIDEVQHKTFVEVNEQGTEAAAATSIGIEATSVKIPEKPPFEMIVDRPFFCAIRDNQTGSILFMGAIVDPQ